MSNYQQLIRAELANNSGTTEYTRDYSRYTSKSSSAWDEAPDADFFANDDDDNMDAGFFSSDEDDDMQCMFYNN